MAEKEPSVSVHPTPTPTLTSSPLSNAENNGQYELPYTQIFASCN